MSGFVLDGIETAMVENLEWEEGPPYVGCLCGWKVEPSM